MRFSYHVLCCWLLMVCIFATVNDTDGETMEGTQKKAENISIPAKLELIEIRVEKGGAYAITLGFHPTTNSLQEFESVLRNDFTGEIEIILDNKHYKTVQYEDFSAFAHSPVGDLYGPVYHFDLDSPPLLGFRNYELDFYPKIKGKKPCVFSFSLQRQKKSFGKKVTNFFTSLIDSENDTPKKKSAKPEIGIPAIPESINIEIEEAGRYGIRIGFRQDAVPGTKATRSFDGKLYTDFDGVIEISHQGEPYSIIRYDEAIGMDFPAYAKFVALGYLFHANATGFYSFVPKIMSVQDRSFGFFLDLTHMRK